ncbi:MAG: hypothetical protein IPO21_01350 [Bacteroidales bacterium]|nr:hypothetical protein [Bacteroidales bacterium]
MKKKILILAYDFPPYNSIGGQRPYSWYKYFRDNDLYPIVVTRHWDIDIKNPVDYIRPSICQETTVEDTEFGTVIRIPFKPNLRDRLILKYGLERFTLLRKFLTVFFLLTEFYISNFDNRKQIFSAAKKYLKQNKVDAIIATGEPFILFKYASLLSKYYQIPWIADYRDGWSSNYNLSRLERRFYAGIEKNIVNKASFITSVSREFVEGFKKLFPQKNVFEIKNGYFPELFSSIDVQENEHFTISFAGTLYSYQPIELFAEGFRRFANVNNTCKLIFVGSKFYPEQAKRIEKAFGSIQCELIQTERLSHQETLKILNSSQLLLLPASAEKPQTYAKVFDYLALQKYILLFEDDKASLSEIIKTTNSGYICNTSIDIENTLHMLYNQHLERNNSFRPKSNFELYSRKTQTKLFAQKIKELWIANTD